MDPTDRFTTKAGRYARYRWGYAPEAIQALTTTIGLNHQSVVADIGSGTGILTRELVGKVKTIYAVEPNPAMRLFAEQQLSQHPSFVSVVGRAEATTLLRHSIDLLIAGEALHWFEPVKTLKEFQRILKPDGYLAAFFHSKIDQAIYNALKLVCTEDNGWDTTQSPIPLYGKSHTDTYFDTGNGIKMHYPQTWQESWEVFLGGILSDSHSPNDTHAAFSKLVTAVRRVFDQFSDGGTIQVHGGTDLVLGRLRMDMP